MNAIDRAVKISLKPEETRLRRHIAALVVLAGIKGNEQNFIAACDKFCDNENIKEPLPIEFQTHYQEIEDMRFDWQEETGECFVVPFDEDLKEFMVRWAFRRIWPELRKEILEKE